MSSLILSNDILTLDEQTQLDFDNANQIRLHRNILKNELLVDVIFDKLDKKIKDMYLSVYSCKNKELQLYISEYINSLSGAILNTFSNEQDIVQFSNKHKYFYNNFYAQRQRWVKMALDNLKTNDIAIQKYKQDNYVDLDDNKFNIVFKKNISSWKSSKGLMIDFPLFKYMNNGRSKKSAFNYDIGTVVYDILSKSMNDSLIYRQMDVLVNNFSPYSRKIPKYKVIHKNKGKDKDILINQSTYNNQKIEIKEQVSLLDTINDDTNEKREILELLKDDLTPETRVHINKTIKSNKLMFQPFDGFDLDIISYTLNHADSNFYLNRKIVIPEIDILRYFGKDPKQPKNRKWLRDRYQKISKKRIVVVEKRANSKKSSTHYITFPVFDTVDMETGNYSLKSIEIIVGNEIYNNILREDTINVYKKDFLSIKNSKYPDAILLIYNLQLLRFSSYQINKNTVQIATSYFIDIIKIKSKNKVMIHSVIQDYLNQFIDNNVIINSFEYIPQQQSWILYFIDLTDRDLKILINSRKDYYLSAQKFTHLLE